MNYEEKNNKFLSGMIVGLLSLLVFLGLFWVYGISFKGELVNLIFFLCLLFIVTIIFPSFFLIRNKKDFIDACAMLAAGLMLTILFFISVFSLGQAFIHSFDLSVCEFAESQNCINEIVNNKHMTVELKTCKEDRLKYLQQLNDCNAAK